jgi:hypothetical protein
VYKNVLQTAPEIRTEVAEIFVIEQLLQKRNSGKRILASGV